MASNSKYYKTVRLLIGQIESWSLNQTVNTGYVRLQDYSTRPLDGFNLAKGIPLLDVGTKVDLVYFGYSPEDKPRRLPSLPLFDLVCGRYISLERCKKLDSLPEQFSEGNNWIPDFLFGINSKPDGRPSSA